MPLWPYALAVIVLVAIAIGAAWWALFGQAVDPEWQDAAIPSDWGEPVTEWPETGQR